MKKTLALMTTTAALVALPACSSSTSSAAPSSSTSSTATRPSTKPSSKPAAATKATPRTSSAVPGDGAPVGTMPRSMVVSDAVFAACSVDQSGTDVAVGLRAGFASNQAIEIDDPAKVYDRDKLGADVLAGMKSKCPTIYADAVAAGEAFSEAGE